MNFGYVFQKIKDTAPTNEKLHILTAGVLEIHRLILQATYDKEKFGVNTKTLQKVFGIDNIKGYEDIGHWVHENREEQGECSDIFPINFLETFIRGSRQFSGNKLVNYLGDVFRLLPNDHVVWLCRMLQKNLRIGMNITQINKALAYHKLPLIEVFITQLCKSVVLKDNKFHYEVKKGDKRVLVETNDIKLPAFAETKYDGTRIIADVKIELIDKGLYGKIDVFNIRLFNRSGLEKTSEFPEIVEALKEFCVQNDLSNTILDGEVISSDFNALQHRLGTKGENIVKDDSLSYRVFDVIKLEGEDIKDYKFGHRLFTLENFRYGGKVEISECEKCHTTEDVEKFYKLNIDRGEEGIILKSADGTYAQESKDERKGQWKLKPNFTMDLKVVGYEYGKGRNSNWVSVLKVSNEEGTIKSDVGTGLDDKWKIRLTEMKDELIGRIIEVKYWELQPSDEEGVQSLRFPVFITLRDDKDKSD